MNATVRGPRSRRPRRALLAGAAPAAGARRHRDLRRRHPDRHLLHPGRGPAARPEGADDPDDPRLGRQPRRPTRTARPRRGDRQRRRGAAAQGRLQRADLGLARVRPVRRHGDGRLQGQRGPRRPGADRLARQAARGAARRGRATRAWACTAPPTRAGSSSSPPAIDNADRRDRARHRLALAPDQRSTRRRRSRAAGHRCSTRPARPAGPAGPAHHAPPSSPARATGKLSRRGPRLVRLPRPGDALVDRIRVPTLLLQGTADTLFTLAEAITNYEILRGNGVPVKMIWFCGGHGACLTGSGPGGPLRGAP